MDEWSRSSGESASDCENENSEYDSSDGNSDSEGFSDSQAEETDGDGTDATTEAEDDDDREEYSAANMRKRIKRLQEDEEEADDDDNDSPVKRPRGKKSKSRRILSSDEEGEEPEEALSSGDDAGQTCTICLLKFESQELGCPSSCSHVFCADCIVEWTANVPTCPIDRKNVRSVWRVKGTFFSCVIWCNSSQLSPLNFNFIFEGGSSSRSVLAVTLSERSRWRGGAPTRSRPRSGTATRESPSTTSTSCARPAARATGATPCCCATAATSASIW